MGNTQNSITRQQLEEMREYFSEDDLRRLHRRFRKLDTTKSGTLALEEFLAIPELEHNPLVDIYLYTHTHLHIHTSLFLSSFTTHITCTFILPSQYSQLTLIYLF